MNDSTLEHYVAFVDYDNDFSMPEQRIVGPFQPDKATEVEEKMEQAAGITNTKKIMGNDISNHFPLDEVHPTE